MYNTTDFNTGILTIPVRADTRLTPNSLCGSGQLSVPVAPADGFVRIEVMDRHDLPANGMCLLRIHINGAVDTTLRFSLE